MSGAASEPGLRFLLGKVLEVSLIFDSLRKSRGRKYFRLFSGYFIINFSRMCLRDQVFCVLLEHFYF